MTTNQPPGFAAAEPPAGRLARLGPGVGVDGRQAALSVPLRAFHQRLLKAFLTGTSPPDAAVVGRQAAQLELDPQAALVALAAADLVHPDSATGSLSVAYPFSGRPTPHRVELAGGPAVVAMCAIDALGIPQMLGRDGHISSNDPAHTNTEAADAYRRAHPGMTGQLFGQSEAVQAAWQAFGGLLDRSNPQERTP